MRDMVILIVLAASVSLLSCSKNNITGTTSGKNGRTATKDSLIVKGTITGQNYYSFTSPYPLKGAVLKLDSLVAVTDSTGAFQFDSVAPGKHKLEITGQGFLPIDTSVVTGDSTTTVSLHFMFYEFGGTIYLSYPLSYPQYTSPELTPIKADLVLDNQVHFQTTATKHNFDLGLLAAGVHTLHIDSSQYWPGVDTTFDCTSNFDFGYTNDYQFYFHPYPREFVFPTSIGATWRYFYTSSYTNSTTGEQDHSEAIDTWKLESVSHNGVDDSLFIRDIRIDTVSKHSDNGYWPDTSYISSDTVTFSIAEGSSSITVGCPELSGITLPRQFYSTSDTLVVRPEEDYNGGPFYSKQVFVSGLGLLNFQFTSAPPYYVETGFSLRQFTP